VSAALDGLPLPDRVTGRHTRSPAPPRAVPTRHPARTGASTVAGTAGTVVRAGDSLWLIAAEHLGPDATDADVARYVAALHAANRQVIGPDPDLVLPGQQLDFPSTTTLPEDS
jgi:Tfp pilus assembly protein FimV